MKIATSVLGIKDNIEESIKKLDNTTTDYVHIDIMDGIFVENNTIEQMNKILNITNKPLVIHLMVEDVESYIDLYSKYNPEYLIFHVETPIGRRELIKKIRSLGIKVGMAINPSTHVDLLERYLPLVDMVLVMTVNPGYSGGEFLPEAATKIEELNHKKYKYEYKYLISVDGGITDKTKKLVNGTDILVSGSFITNSNYQKQIDKLLN